jgi:hypothetical protein
MLHPSFLQDSAFASLVGVAEFPFRAIGDHLDVMMGMKRPDSTWRECIVIEDPQCPELHVFRVVVVTKGEMPSAVKGAIHYFSLDLINTFRFTDEYLGLCYGCSMRCHGYPPCLTLMSQMPFILLV